MPAAQETINLFEEIEEAIHSGKNLRAALTGSPPSGSQKTAESPARLNRSEARATSQVLAERRDTESQQHTSSNSTKTLSRSEKAKRVTTGDTLPLKAKTRGPSHSPKLARPNITSTQERVGGAKR